MQEKELINEAEFGRAEKNPEQDKDILDDCAQSLEEQLRQSELKSREYYDDWLRAKAETENVRRRAKEDILKAHKYSIEKFAGELLGVKDSLEAALATETPSVHSLKTGSELTLKQLSAAFEKVGISEISPLPGDKFDPHLHQAISVIESTEEQNTIVSVLQKGYLLAERVLRPAFVVVSKSSA